MTRTARHTAGDLNWEFVFDATHEEAERALSEAMEIVMRFGEEHGYFEQADPIPS